MKTHLHFVQALDPLHGGGLGPAALDLHLTMMRQGVDSRLVSTGDRAAADPGQSFSVYRRRGPTRAFYAPQLRGDVARTIDDIDVVHGHGFYVYPNLVVPSLARAADVPFVYHPHGSFEPWAQARSVGRKRIVGIWFEDKNVRQAALWRALTKQEADQIRSRGIDAPIVVAPNGVDLGEFPTCNDRGNLAVRSDRRTLLFLGRIHPKKGLDLLIDAWAHVRDVSAEWEVVIAGPDELGIRPELEAAARQRGIEGDVSFVGTVEGSAKRDLLQSADAFVLPSRSEGFPVALIEAMASCLPVVATRATNVAGIEEHGAGFECDPESGSVRTALHRLLALDDRSRTEMGANGRAWVEADFTWPSITETILQACDASLT